MLSNHLKLDSIHLYHLRMPLISPFETSFGKSTHRDCILIEARSAGLAGWGECVADRDPGYAYETSQTAWHILIDYLIPQILSQQTVHPEDVQKVFKTVRGHSMAKAGIEMSIWDLLGKMTGKSLRELLGGEKDRVKVGVSVGIQPSPQLLAETVEKYLKDGYQRIKIKIKPGRDLEDIETVRRTFPDTLLQVDANSAYTLEKSDVFKKIDDYQLLLIEQPLAEDDLWDHHILQNRLQTPLCLDESILSTRHARQAIEMQACRIINIKAGRVGGLHEAKAIHNYCLARKVPVWCGGMLETGVGRAANLALASLPGFVLPGDISGTDRYYQEDITDEKFILNPDSTIDVPVEPGLGIHINRQIVKKYTLAEFESLL